MDECGVSDCPNPVEPGLNRCWFHESLRMDMEALRTRMLPDQYCSACGNRLPTDGEHDCTHPGSGSGRA
jgi:hypothetical protein